ncbi:MAG: N-acetyltransferase [Candidatus Omnitrophica bacterium]|nr:N-acetyltransferase [Candidatus Omnitrophota bacterium]
MIRKARVGDIKEIQGLINTFADKDLMLPRSLNELYESIRDFWVYVDGKKIVGCAALHISWSDLSEIKSLAVQERFQGRGIGKELISVCIKEAKELGSKRVFVLTYHQKYFNKLGFKRIKHDDLPHKIWAECINCPKFPNCQEIALVKNIAN